MVELGLLFSCRVRDPVGAGKEPIEVIEASVFGIDHDDGPDLAEAFLAV